MNGLVTQNLLLRMITFVYLIEHMFNKTHTHTHLRSPSNLGFVFKIAHILHVPHLFVISICSFAETAGNTVLCKQDVAEQISIFIAC